MKRIILFLFLTLSLAFSGFAQEQESARPLTDTEIVRRINLLDIEGKHYFDVTMTLKSISPDYLISDKYKVKVTIKDMNGNKIWKKTLKNVYLYVFSNGQVQVGKRNFNQILIQKDPSSNKTFGIIREKEGIY